jgi:hypothetical protein
LALAVFPVFFEYLQKVLHSRVLCVVHLAHLSHMDSPHVPASCIRTLAEHNEQKALRVLVSSVNRLRDAADASRERFTRVIELSPITGRTRKGTAWPCRRKSRLFRL